MLRIRRALSAVAAIAFVAGGLMISPAPAEAAVASNFNPGYIISDGLFFKGNAMTSAEVQSFLQSKVPVCDSHHAGGSYVCLKDYRVTNPAWTADAYCSSIPAGNHSAADLIALVGQACGISQKVLIVLLEKEQSLVSDAWPGATQYLKATGYGCPDSAACDSRYYGLFNQLVMAARAFQAYTAHPSSYRYHAGQTNSIQYSPDTTCGTRSVYIQNAATAALYIYTPYTPDAAALANLYGQGGHCSSYGNRNFWRLYTDWFGNPTDLVPMGVSVSRVGGADRYVVSAAMSAKYFAPNAPVAYIASGTGFADAISAGPAAAKGGGPVLLVQPNLVPSSVATELARLKPARIVVVGGAGAVSDAVVKQLGQYSAQVKRVAGADRFATSRAVLLDAFGSTVKEAYLATGNAFPDALSASAAAGYRKDPILLVDGTQPQLDADTSALLTNAGVSKVFISGGTGAVSAGIEQQLDAALTAPQVIRLSGTDRYATSNAVNTNAFVSVSTFFVASGGDFPDALSAAPIAAKLIAPLYVTQPSCVTRAMAQHMIDSAANQLVIVGGTGAVSAAVAQFKNC